MSIKFTEQTTLVITPFEKPDYKLVLEGVKAGAISFLDLGRDIAKAEVDIRKIVNGTNKSFGIRIPEGVECASHFLDKYKESIKYVIHASPDSYSAYKKVKNIIQVVSLEEAIEAEKMGADALILKGAESGGRVGDLNSFILLQKVAGKLQIPYWCQGGMGPHSATAAIIAGANGVVYDSQLALFGSASTSSKLRKIISGLNGSETLVVKGYRYLNHLLCGKLEPETDVIPQLLNDEIVLAGEDIVLANLFYESYGDLKSLVYLTDEAISRQFRQTNQRSFITENSAFARQFGLRYPIIQGPMTRVSDVPAFASKIAEDGALPSIALAVLKAEEVSTLLEDTKKIIVGKPWSVGILGFLPTEILKPQIDKILEIKPNYVIIAGGRPEQVTLFKKNGIESFIHCPSPRLFSQFAKENVRNFIFEGRECGGHVGPISSMVLWEYQISQALEMESSDLSLVFAGGIHDKLSVAMVEAMTQLLDRKGCKIGVLVGTAYLFTNEAVQTGAILSNYQQLAIESTSTVLIQTGPGHNTRCLPTPFVDFIEDQRKKMEKEMKSKEEIFQQLETLNVGHLRIASKGKMRIDGSLQEVDENTQFEKGMFMIGDVAQLRDASCTIRDLHSEMMNTKSIFEQLKPKDLKKEKAPQKIAIIGMSGILPDAHDLNEYWSNILNSVDSIKEVPDDRWSKELYFDPTSRGAKGEKTYSKWGGFIPDFYFDPTFFGIPPQVLASIEPAQLCALKVAYDLLKDADYIDKPFNRERVSVVFGYEPGGDVGASYGLRMVLPQLLSGDKLAEVQAILPSFNEDSFPGILGNIIAGRISNRLNLGGQNFTIDAACASSLAAIDVAIKELLTGDSEMVIAGGIDMHNCLSDYIYFSSVHALSPTGRCATFSKEANGMSLGEGSAAVLLKRYEDAVNDGDTIHAVICGVGSSSDGKSLGLTAPRKKGQKRNLENTYRKIGVSPSEIGLIEAHGTGTAVGDQTELSTLEEVFAWSGVSNSAVALGSVKSQIGHTKCTAGIAGLIKCVQSVKYGILPPTLHITEPNLAYKEDKSSFYFLNAPRPWLSDDRKAGISSFGFGGTNFHVVIENDPLNTALPSPKKWSHELFLIKGKDQSEANEWIKIIQQYIELEHTISLCDLAFSVNQYKPKNEAIQIVIVAQSIEDLSSKLKKALVQERVLEGIHYAEEKKITVKEIAFLFAGQGAQFIGMGREIMLYFPETRNYLKEHPQFNELLYPPYAFSEEDDERQNAQLTDTNVAQPAIGIVSLAISQILVKLGIQATQVAGHSYGELTALTYAGTIQQQDLIPFSIQRAKAICNASENGKGSMLAIECSESEIRSVIQELKDVEIANVNASNQIVIAGTNSAIENASNQLRDQGFICRKIKVSHAFHSSLLKGAEVEYNDFLSTQSLNIPSEKIAVWSNKTGKAYSNDLKTIQKTLTEQLVSPVQYTQIIEGIEQNGATIFVEVGPGNIASHFVNNTLNKEKITTLPTLQKNTSFLKTFFNTIAQLSIKGIEIDTDYLYANRETKLLHLLEPQAIAKTNWIVNGRWARPMIGSIPSQGFDPERKFNQIDLQSNSQVIQSEKEEKGSSTTLNKYFETLDHFVNTQKEVMLNYLGSNLHKHSFIPSSFSEEKLEIPIQNQKTLSLSITQQPEKKNEFSKVKIEQILKNLISERTGYPIEMLESTLDIESDLGIDSIKRVELLTDINDDIGLSKSFENSNQGSDEAVQLLEKVARLKTIQDISSWLFEKLQQTDSKINNEKESSLSEPKEIQEQWDFERLENLLKTLISERTGYPTEMLESNLDIESDLGIDSIKRIELLSELGNQTGLSHLIGNADQGSDETVQMLAKVAKLKTIKGIAEWLLLLSKGSSQANENGANEDETKLLNSFKIIYSKEEQILDKEIDFTNKTMYILFEKYDIFIDKIATRLKEENCKVKIISYKQFQLEEPVSPHGVICISNGNLPGKGNYNDFYAVFNAARKLGTSLTEFFTVITLNEEVYLNDGNYEGPLSNNGLSGFLASLQKEWPKVKITCISVHDKEEEKIENAILKELKTLKINDYALNTVSFYQQQRYKRSFEDDLNSLSTQKTALNSDSVILLVGGAKGITSWLASALADKYKCHIVIIGRSKMPDPEEEQYTNIASDKLRQLIIQEGGTSVKPREIEEKIKQKIANREMLNNMAEIERMAASVTYYSQDITHQEGTEITIEKIQKQFGRIDGCIFAAGIINDKFIQDKTDDQVEKIYRTKVDGAFNVITALQVFSKPKFVVLYSSLSASLGNRGQTDYSAANSVLDGMATYYNTIHKTHYLSINWGPWLGAGMIDEVLHNHLKKIGIHGIERKNGVNFLLNEIENIRKDKPLILALSAINDDFKNLLLN